MSWMLNGKPITGNEDEIMNNFRIIPDNTFAPAVIKKIENDNWEGEVYYTVYWQILDGEYKGAQVRQKLKINNEKPEKKARDLNALARLYFECGMELPEKQPNELGPYEFINIYDKPMDILIGLVKADNGNHYNFVRCNWALGTKEYTQSVPSNEERTHLTDVKAMSNMVKDTMDDDIPF